MGDLLHDFLDSETVVQPFSDKHLAQMIQVSQLIGIVVNENGIIGSHFQIIEDLLTYGSLEGFFYLTQQDLSFLGCQRCPTTTLH